MATLPPLGDPNYKLAEALKQLSAAKYGKAKAGVEKEIFARLATAPEPPRPAPSYGAVPPPAAGGAYGSPRSAAPSMGAQYGSVPAAAPVAPRQPGGGSFLDEWMTKRSSPAPGYTNPWAKPAAPQPPANASTSTALPQPTSLPPTAPSYGYNPTLAAQPPAYRPPYGNTMSGATETAEVTGIAQELRQELRPQHGAVTTSPNPITTQSSAPIQERHQLPASPAQTTRHEGEISLKSASGSPEDTIYIDKEGNLHAKD